MVCVKTLKLLTLSAEARSLVYGTLGFIKTKNFQEVENNLKIAEELLLEASLLKNNLLNLENDQPVKLNIPLIQAVEHFNTSCLMKELIKELINFM